MRSSTSRCLMAERIRRTVDRRALSLARIAAFMSSVIFSLRDVLVQLLRQHLAAQALVVALYGGGKLALALCGRLLVVLAGAQLGEQARLFHGALEAAHRDFERLVFFHSYGRHVLPKLGSGLERG